MKKIALLLTLSLILVIASGCVKSSSPATTEFPPVGGDNGNQVQIANFSFQPSDITVKKGTTVPWTNRDEAKHTITSDQGTELDSELVGKGETFSHTFDQTGVFPYLCTPHPFMKGKITVSE